jgi:hypothetical protein
LQYRKNRQNLVLSHLDLPRSLQIKVANANYIELINKCRGAQRPLAGTKTQFINAMLLRLNVSHMMPGENIVKRDEIPRELYFVLSGSVQVMEDQCRVLPPSLPLSLSPSLPLSLSPSLPLSLSLSLPLFLALARARPLSRDLSLRAVSTPDVPDFPYHHLEVYCP